MILYQIPKRYRVSTSNTTIYYGVGCPRGGLHVSALYYKAIVRSDMLETIEEQLQC